LGRLKAGGYKLAVASNRPTEFSWILIRHLGLESFFDYVLCADKLEHIKPHPQILNSIMRRFHAGPEETLYVGDMVIDAQAGRRAGIKTVMLTTGSSTRQEIKKERPYRIIGDIRELLEVVS
jgi:phosphoglycolate phosphatase